MITVLKFLKTHFTLLLESLLLETMQYLYCVKSYYVNGV